MHFTNSITDTLKLHRSILTSLETRLNTSQGSITLTTSGTSGASTLIGNSLNIPVYSSGAGTALWGSITGTLSNQTDLNDALSLKQNTLVSGTNIKTVNSTTLLGSGNITTGSVTSVGVSMPTAFTVTNSPIISSGTIAITGAGTTLEYIRGDGTLSTFPSLTGFVPYTGATANVNLGEFGLISGQVTFDQTPTGTAGVGVMRWNDTDGTVDLGLKGGNVTLQVGQEQIIRVVNKTATNITLLEANYQAVRLTGVQGQRLKVDLAQATTDSLSSETIGLVTETILNNQEGFVTTSGLIRGINTTGSLQSETWADGDILYLSPTVAGRITKVKPAAPNHLVIIGYVVHAHITQGTIFVKVDNGYELSELHDVYAPSPLNNDGIFWNTTNDRYQNNTIAGALGYTPVSTLRAINTTSPLIGGGDLSADRTLSIPEATTSVNGYLTSTDWNTFKGKADYAPRVQSVTSSDIVTPTSTNDLVKITAQAIGLTIANPTGTMSEGQAMIIRIKDDGTARTIAFGTNYRAIGVTLPTTTTISKTIYIGLVWNDTDTKFDVLGINTQA